MILVAEDDDATDDNLATDSAGTIFSKKVAYHALHCLCRPLSCLTHFVRMSTGEYNKNDDEVSAESEYSGTLMHDTT